VSQFRFIHCSDLHIDSPFKKLGGVDDAMRERLRAATLDAFGRIVDLALSERADAVVIAGDVFDGEDKSLQAQFRFRDQLKRLAGAGIPAFIAHGNHDPLDSWSRTLDWPAGVHVFPGDRVTSISVERNGETVAQISGISYPKKEVLDNLVPYFKDIDPAVPSVAVLHANVGGNPNHDNYAPCSLEDLTAVKVDYWALGHIHQPQVLKEARPAVVYSGNPQARQFREGGEKGCYLVALTPGQPPQIQFHAVDVVRYLRDTLDVTACDTLDALVESVQSACREQLERIGRRHLVLELTLTGRTAVHGDLQDETNLGALRDAVLTGFENATQSLWLELEADTTGFYDLDALRQGRDFIADVIHQYDRIVQSDDLHEWKRKLEPVFGARGYLEAPDDATLRLWLGRARDLTLDHLVPDEDRS